MLTSAQLAMLWEGIRVKSMDALTNDRTTLRPCRRSQMGLWTKQAAELEAAELEDAKNRLKAHDVVIQQLQLNLDKLKRSQSGQSSEKLQIDQLELALEDLQSDRAAEKVGESGDADDKSEDGNKKDKKKHGRKKLPAHLPRERSVLDPGDACPDHGDTKISVLAPKTEKTKTGHIWVVVRGGRHYRSRLNGSGIRRSSASTDAAKASILPRYTTPTKF